MYLKCKLNFLNSIHTLVIPRQWEEEGEKSAQKACWGRGRLSNDRETFHNLEGKGHGVELNRLSAR